MAQADLRRIVILVIITTICILPLGLVGCVSCAENSIQGFSSDPDDGIPNEEISMEEINQIIQTIKNCSSGEGNPDEYADEVYNYFRPEHSSDGENLYRVSNIVIQNVTIDRNTAVVQLSVTIEYKVGGQQKHSLHTVEVSLLKADGVVKIVKVSPNQ